MKQCGSYLAHKGCKTAGHRKDVDLPCEATDSWYAICPYRKKEEPPKPPLVEATEAHTPWRR